MRRDWLSRSIAFGVGAIRIVGDVAEPDPVAGWRVDRQCCDIGEAVARRRDRSNVHVVRLPAVEDVADLLARDQRRCLPPDVTRVQPVLPGLGQVDLDLDVGQIGLEVDAWASIDASMPASSSSTSSPAPAASRSGP